MSQPSAGALQRLAPGAARAAGAAVALIGCGGLAGWSLDSSVPFLRGQPPIAPNTAAALVLAGAALWLLLPKPAGAGKPRRLAGRALAAVVLVVGLATVAEYLWGADLGIDRLLFAQKSAAAGMPAPGRPSHYAALSLLLAGGALLVLDFETRGGHLPSQSLALAAGLVGALAIEGHIVGYAPFFRVSATSGIAMQAAVAVVLLAAGVLCARPDRGLMALLSSPGPAGSVARRLLPVPFAVSFILSWLGLVGGRMGLYDRAVGVWLLQVSNLVVFTWLIWYNARVIERADSERRRTQEELEARTRELEEANKELEAFSYSVSHDLRAPLRAIDGFSRILAEESAGALDAAALSHLDRVRAGAQQMARLIDDLLAFSRLSRQPLSRKSVDTGQMVREVLAEAHVDPNDPRVELTVHPMPACMADRALLKQVYVNLISNALKFTRHRPTAHIEIGARLEDGNRVYFVKDDGAGFDMRYADKLFGVFQRLHRADEFEGTGVGLAIVQRIVHRHGGRVWAEGRPGEGATFYFTVPGEASSETPAAAGGAGQA